ncbi:MAG: sensor domain-containing diguanylate cyclase [Pseudomonadota bacterium]
MQPLLAAALERLASPVFITDEAGRIVWVNAAFCQLSGYSPDEVLGQTPAMLHSGPHGAHFYEQLWQTVRAGNVWHGEVVDQRKDGTLYTAEEVISPLQRADGHISNFIALQHDITQRERMHQHEHYMAYHDALTGLPNRALLQVIQQKAISQAHRTQQLLAVMFIDLDGFKPVNDSLGHSAGDQLLAAVGERLRSSIRQSDTIARVGGDEFAMLVTGLDNTETAEALAQKLLDNLARPFAVGGHRIQIHASIGIAIYPAHGTDGDVLLVNADRAMYQAKLKGGNRAQFFVQGAAMGWEQRINASDRRH